MIKKIAKNVGKLTFHKPMSQNNKEWENYGWENYQYTSNDPSDWRIEDVDHIINSLAVGIGKSPVIGVDYIRGSGNGSHNLMRFELTYEIKVPRTTLKRNREAIKYYLFMECV